MAKLDARNWMEFRIGDIFRMNNTKSIVQKDVVPDSGTVPYVTAQAGNNGYFPKLVGLFGYERNFSFKETLFFW